MCVYKTQEGICRNLSDSVHIAYCVEGPCPHDTPSNADRIRGMSDEELAAFLIDVDIDNATLPFTNNWLDWLRQPWKEDADG